MEVDDRWPVVNTNFDASEVQSRLEAELTRLTGLRMLLATAYGEATRGQRHGATVEAALGIATEIVETLDALARVKMGHYGICVDCGEPINEQRLAAFPLARRCLADELLEENRLKRMSPSLTKAQLSSLKTTLG